MTEPSARSDQSSPEVRPYSLTLFSPAKPASPEGIRLSAQMIAFGLWEELRRLSGLTVHYVDTGYPLDDYPPADFALIHDYFDSPVYERLPEIRHRTRCRVMGIMEVIYESPLIDYAFSFRPTSRQNTEQIPLPCLRSLLDATRSTPRIRGSILLDHGWIEEGTCTDWCGDLYQWLEPFAHARSIGQLRRHGHEVHAPPPWIESIAEAGYPAYLEATAPYETFVVTHPGSYEHSIIDMAARDVRVLVPSQGGRPFCHPSLVDDLGLSVFEGQADFVRLLHETGCRPRLDRLTDMPDVVRRIDAYCRGVLADQASSA